MIFQNSGSNHYSERHPAIKGQVRDGSALEVLGEDGQPADDAETVDDGGQRDDEGEGAKIERRGFHLELLIEC